MVFESQTPEEPDENSLPSQVRCPGTARESGADGGAGASAARGTHDPVLRAPLLCCWPAGPVLSGCLEHVYGQICFKRRLKVPGGESRRSHPGTWPILTRRSGAERRFSGQTPWFKFQHQPYYGIWIWGKLLKCLCNL